MRFSLRRHIGSFSSYTLPQARKLKAAAASGPGATLHEPSGPFEQEFSPRDYVTFLLHMDAQIEHGLMVQYLYAAYSLGGPQVPESMRDKVRTWREILLGIAKEEMGHLITVQNVLRLIGAPLCFERDDYPWSTPFYPFPFALEPLTLESLAKYIYAESPEDWSGELADEIKARVKKTVPNPRRVGALFKDLIENISDADALPESIFQRATTEFQADFNEWGRGYEAGKRGNASGANPPATPDVIIRPLWSRAEAIAALKAIAEQGEAPQAQEDAAPSHFARFCQVYVAMAKAPQDVSYALPVAANPYVSWSDDAEPGSEFTDDEPRGAITHPEAVMWAQLHNLRYRMLLALLEHTFHERGGPASNAGATRGLLINAAFGEMYNLRAISELLMRLPLSKGGGSVNAGPPFQMPYTLQLPAFAADRWQVHLDVLEAAGLLMHELMGVAGEKAKKYLKTCLETDGQVKSVIVKVLRTYREAT